MMNNPYERYRSIQIETANKGKLLLLLYNGALKFLRQAEAGIKENNYNDVHNYLVKGQAIIWELDMTLNMEAGGEIAANLRVLYQYMNKRLVEANLQKDAAIIEEVIGLLSELKEGWDAIILKRPAAVSTSGG